MKYYDELTGQKSIFPTFFAEQLLVAAERRRLACCGFGTNTGRQKFLSVSCSCHFFVCSSPTEVLRLEKQLDANMH